MKKARAVHALVAVLTISAVASLVNFWPLGGSFASGALDLGGLWHRDDTGGDYLTPARLRIDPLSTVVTVSRDFDRPHICRPTTGSCDLFFATISDPADIYLNGEHVGRVGEPPPKVQYSKVSPVRIFLRPDLIKDRGNHLEVVLFTSGWGVHGFTRGPIGIFASPHALALAQATTAGTVVLPLASALVILLLLLSVYLECEEARQEWGAWRVFAGYCLVSALFLVSLSRVPRQFLPNPLGHCLHYALLFFSHGALAALVKSTLFCTSKALRCVRDIFIVAGCACPALVLLGHGQEHMVDRVGETINILSLTTPVLATVVAVRSREYRHLSVLFGILAAMRLWDVCALLGMLPDVFFSRFSSLLVVVVLAQLLRRRQAELRQQMEVDARLGLLAAQVAHDIQSPLAALEMLRDRCLVGESPATESLFSLATGRIRSIAQSLLERRRSEIRVAALSGSELAAKAQAVVVSQVIRLVIAEKRAILPHGVDLDYDERMDAAAWTAQAEPAALARVVSNLLDNAIQAVGRGGRVRVDVLRHALIGIRITDGGPGLASHRGTPPTRGNGLGLPYARRCATAWRGRLDLRNAAGGGCRATLWLRPAPTA